MLARTQEDERFDLLTAIDMLAAHATTVGFVGHVAIGIRGPNGDRWWRGNFGRRSELGFVERPARDADAIFLLGERDARVLLETRALPDAPELSLVCGDRRLLERFLRRFAFTPGSAVSIRAQRRE
jgi:hypothetical protein